jgi:hypothetical protein
MLTSLGATAGYFIHGVAMIFRPTLDRFNQYIAVENLEYSYFIAAGIVLANLHAFRKRDPLPADIEEMFEAVRRADVTPLQRRLMHLQIVGEALRRTSSSRTRRTERRPPAAIAS